MRDHNAGPGALYSVLLAGAVDSFPSKSCGAVFSSFRTSCDVGETCLCTDMATPGMAPVRSSWQRLWQPLRLHRLCTT